MLLSCFLADTCRVFLEKAQKNLLKWVFFSFSQKNNPVCCPKSAAAPKSKSAPSCDAKRETRSKRRKFWELVVSLVFICENAESTEFWLCTTEKKIRLSIRLVFMLKNIFLLLTAPFSTIAGIYLSSWSKSGVNFVAIFLSLRRLT